MIGSITPDVAYAIDDLNKFSKTVVLFFGQAAENFTSVREAWDWDDFSHTFSGSIGFCLPVSLLMLTGFLSFRSTIVAMLPNPHREVLRPFCLNAPPSFLSSIGSLLIGIWLHLGWDCFTNGDRWLGKNWTFLHHRVLELGSTQIEVHRLLWGCSSLGGTAILLIAYLRFLKVRNRPFWVFTKAETGFYGFWLAALLGSAFIATPLTLHFVHPGLSIVEAFNFCHRFIGYFLASFCGIVVLAVVFLKLSQNGVGAK